MKRLWTILGLLALGFANPVSAQAPPVPRNSPVMPVSWGAPLPNGPIAHPYAVPVYGMHAPSPEDHARKDRYGLHPVLKRLFHVKDGDTCGTGSCGKEDCRTCSSSKGRHRGGCDSGCGGDVCDGGKGKSGLFGSIFGGGHKGDGRVAKNCDIPVGPPPPAQGGTLVFPNHPFARSPRDFFMMDR